MKTVKVLDNCFIRLAREDDYAQIETILQQMQAMHIELRSDIFKPSETMMSMDQLQYMVKRNLMYVAESDKRVVGVMGFLPRHVVAPARIPRDVLFVDVLAVHKRYRHRGVGRLLFEHLKIIARQGGFERVEAQVCCANILAYDIFLHYGFMEKTVTLEMIL